MEKQILSLPRHKLTRLVYNKFPETPGIYIYWRKDKSVYVGKSINLKSRLLSYLAVNLGEKTKNMMTEADSVSFIKVTTEIESLLLEAKLIKAYKPKYNIAAKDDKHPLYIAVTRDYLPKVLAGRSEDSKLYQYSYGPFPNSYNVRVILKMIRRVFPYADHPTGKRPCLYSHFGLCDPCPNYLNTLTDSKLKRELEAKYKKSIKNIKKFLDGKFTSVQKDLIKQMKHLSKRQEFEEAAKIRNQLRSLDYIIQPRIDPTEFIKNPNLEEDIRNKDLAMLQKVLKTQYRVSNGLHRIECYDVAHLMGTSATASMIVFIDGESEKSEYRHFRIRQTKTKSDYDSLTEIAGRRLKNLKADKGSWNRPDLIVVDGGLGQVKKFNDIFKAENIPVVGIAKHPDRIIFPDGTKLPATRLLQRMRDEAHRFARRYHHKLISKFLFK